MMIVTMMTITDTKSGEEFSGAWVKVFASLIYFGVFTSCFRSPDGDDDGNGKSKKDDKDGDT
jgi:hypothetical protein